MIASKDKKKRDTRALKDKEIRPNAWKRFERAVDAAVKSGPKHRIKRQKLKKNRMKDGQK